MALFLTDNIKYKALTTFCAFMALSLFLFIYQAGECGANDAVYSALPEDIEVLSYKLGDIDGDSRDELGVLYRSGDRINLALFSAPSENWTLLFELGKYDSFFQGEPIYSFEMADTDGDNTSEVLTYYLVQGGDALATRILKYREGEKRASLYRTLEDTTSPPGYPLLGITKGLPSVTFMHMGDPGTESSGSPGYQRTWCWDGTSFEKCLEVPWGVGVLGKE